MISHELIPNNVNLSRNRKLKKALEAWHPKFMKWWNDKGPAYYQDKEIYLRTAVSVEPSGWAHFKYVKMPEYRWGIFLAPLEGERTIHFGDRLGEKAWDFIPGEHRKDLRRLIVTQADTEPASVEQQRLLAATAPSLYDMRNLFQVNVEEARHLWAMVYLLQQFFGRDGREEAEELLYRCAGSQDSPRILSTFNEPIETWLDFFCFATFTDRDGKYQLGALAESAFNPLSQSTRFMLTEEAHHLFVGETSIARVVRRSAQLAKEDPEEDIKRQGGIPLEIIQKYINFWYSSSLDLFGSENSSNAANFFASGLKGRFNEGNRKLYPDPKCLEGTYVLEVPDKEGNLREEHIPLRKAMNAILRDSYIQDCERVMKRWNRQLEKEDYPFRLRLPSVRFNRKIGVYAGHHFDPEGNLLTAEQWERREEEFLPTQEDRDYVQSLMYQVIEPGKFAHWILAPKKGINGKPIDFEYVRM
ncbi:MAG: benzoyl-CoA 2,3-epoxidase subunit BoxB [Planctomycetota bacterium]|nr:MAG: benzoyl-CoA 2,3-epoxidase subunit BoxB [Planctomycetota bacterium]